MIAIANTASQNRMCPCQSPLFRSHESRKGIATRARDTQSLDSEVRRARVGNDRPGSAARRCPRAQLRVKEVVVESACAGSPVSSAVSE